jgi:ADP-glucose pyrophosphorylase
LNQSIYQNAHLIRNHKPEIVAVFGADHIYKMNIRDMIHYHREKGADVTIAAIPCHQSESRSYGVIQVDESWQVEGFQEKQIGFNVEEDRKKYHVSHEGVVVIPKGSKYDRPPYV